MTHRLALRSTLPTLAILAACGCSAPRNFAAPDPYSAGYIIAPTSDTAAVTGRATWMDPLPVRGREELLFPFAVETERWLLGDHDHFAEGGIQAPSRNDTTQAEDGSIVTGPIRIRWHNAVVADIDSGEQWALLGERGVLSGAWIRSTDDPEDPTVMLFQATVDDTNGDGMLDDEDASRALFVDFEARSARFVTPAHLRLHSVNLSTVPNAALLMLAADEDGDGKFELDEAPTPHLLDLRTGRAARPLLRKDLVEEVEERFTGS